MFNTASEEAIGASVVLVLCWLSLFFAISFSSGVSFFVVVSGPGVVVDTSTTIAFSAAGVVDVGAVFGARGLLPRAGTFGRVGKGRGETVGLKERVGFTSVGLSINSSRLLGVLLTGSAFRDDAFFAVGSS